MAQITDDWCVQIRQKVIKGIKLDFYVIEGILRFRDQVCVPETKV